MGKVVEIGLKHALSCWEIAARLLDHLRHNATFIAQHSGKQVFGLNLAIITASGQFRGILNSFASFISKAFDFHDIYRPLSLVIADG